MIGENLENKVQAVRGYIYEKKGVDIGNINLKTHDDLVKLDHCYQVAVNYFMNNK